MKPGRSQAKSVRVPANKGRQLKQSVLTPTEFERILRLCSLRAPTGIRNRALLGVMYRGGLRIGEALALMPGDFDQASGELRINTTKRVRIGGKVASVERPRTVALDSDFVAVLMRWIDRRRQLGINGGKPIFCTLKGSPISTSYARTVLPRLAQRAGIEKRVSPHTLRHSFAYEWARAGRPLPALMLALGHSQLTTTARYVAHFGTPEVLSLMRASRWEGGPI